ncbi:MAG TPA: hypothetical protein VN672_11525 [Solirubrobacteraceae bacterium]|nr:hypothetical protein [Solirubrobacteraceae bacterium]
MSAEKDDMNCPIGTHRITGRSELAEEARNAATATARAAVERAFSAGGPCAIVGELPLPCVWSGGAEACSCSSCIDRDVVAQAWRRELDASGDHEARFFHFIWDGGVWMAYGLADGDVRGVYCPAHNSQRAERSRALLCNAGDDVLELALAA